MIEMRDVSTGRVVTVTETTNGKREFAIDGLPVFTVSADDFDLLDPVGLIERRDEFMEHVQGVRDSLDALVETWSS